MNGKWSAVSLSFLLAIALLGTALRALPFIQLPIKYDHLLHAHSHTAFQGWVYTAMMLLLANFFLSKEQIQSGKYALQFKLTVVAIAGVLVTFAVQGYGLYSIIFSTLFQLLNYWFIFRFFMDIRHLPPSISLRWVKTSLWLGLLSTLAPFAIGTFSAKGLGGSEAYQSAVYFFLHFQYNGWFQFVALGMFFKWLEMEGVSFDHISARRFYWMFTLAVVPAYTHSLLGMSFGSAVFWPSAMGVSLQVVGLWYFLRLLYGGLGSWFSTKNKWVRLYLWVALSALLLKYASQFLSIFPEIQAVAFTSRNLIVAYLHLCLLGVITCFFMTLFFEFKWLELRKDTQIGSVLFLAGLMGTEILLGTSGMGWGSASLPLLLFSAAMALGIFLLLKGQWSV